MVVRVIHAATIFLTQDVIDYAIADVRELAAEELRRRLEESTRGATIVKGSFRLEQEPFVHRNEVRGSGFRRLLERFRIVRPNTVDVRGVQLRATVRTFG